MRIFFPFNRLRSGKYFLWRQTSPRWYTLSQGLTTLFQFSINASCIFSRLSHGRISRIFVWPKCVSLVKNVLDIRWELLNYPEIPDSWIRIILDTFHYEFYLFLWIVPNQLLVMFLLIIVLGIHDVRLPRGICLCQNSLQNRLLQLL